MPNTNSGMCPTFFTCVWFFLKGRKFFCLGEVLLMQASNLTNLHQHLWQHLLYANADCKVCSGITFNANISNAIYLLFSYKENWHLFYNINKDAFSLCSWSLELWSVRVFLLCFVWWLGQLKGRIEIFYKSI